MMRRVSRTAFTLLATCSWACGTAATPPANTVLVPPGPSWSGSDLDARASAVEFITTDRRAEAADALTRLGAEASPRAVTIPQFVIMSRPVTQAEYARFAQVTGAPEPWIDRTRWEDQGTGFPYAMVQRFAWIEGAPPQARRHHPVVLVDRTDAERYCHWWGDRNGGVGRLPTEAQWNRAARGDDGTAFPWGDAFDPTRANTWETGVGDTVPVGASPESVSAFGVEDLAGNVFEWTRTRTDASHSVLKGGSWSTSLVEARSSARHPAADDLRHITVGFRCVFEPRKPH